jgi:uncharacterized protein
MMSDWEKFKPVPTEDTEPYWEFTAKSELRMQRCKQCGHVRFPPSVLCPKCLSDDYEWAKLSGRGKVFTFAIFHHAFYPGYADDVPYNTAIIELDEGPRMHANVLECDNDDLAIGMPVEVLFEKIPDEDIWLPKFRPVK